MSDININLYAYLFDLEILRKIKITQIRCFWISQVPCRQNFVVSKQADILQTVICAFDVCSFYMHSKIIQKYISTAFIELNRKRKQRKYFHFVFPPYEQLLRKFHVAIRHIHETVYKIWLKTDRMRCRRERESMRKEVFSHTLLAPT